MRPLIATRLSGVAAALWLAATLTAATATAQEPVPAPPVATAEAVTLIHAGTLLAAPPAAPVAQQTLVLRGDRIVEIRRGFVAPESFASEGSPAPRLIDLSRHHVLPGLIDAHVHLSFQSGGNPLLAYRQSDSEQALTALIFARRTLAAGFTTVRDLASGHEVMYAVRNAIRAGRYVGPRILVAGLPITARGGHGDFPGSREDLWQDREARESGICWDEGSCRDAVRAQIKRGADVIKLMASGGFASGTGALQQLTADEMRAVVEAARMRGIRVTTHAYASSAIADAVRSGVDSVEHGIGLDDATAQEMAKRGTYFVPTLMVYQPPRSDARSSMAASAGAPEMSQRAMQRAIRFGVPIAFGTDTGVGWPHGSNAREFQLLTAAGLTPMQALATATTAGAANLGLDKEIGRIAPGFVADIIAVKADPLANPAALESIDFVMKSGRIAKQDGAMLPAERWDSDRYAHP
jgi:imidazolonepropionase-like amidohydrolase